MLIRKIIRKHKDFWKEDIIQYEINLDKKEMQKILIIMAIVAIVIFML